ncbi:hypothetical protein [Nonomuraea turcica]|uniref:hypothetical protein n=1 Tax=Nonomuraea sp. G32 TaxID=3067274 RepID=UPI00273AB710|nr:hypothetical protein [Nonomuraea sp. G32]MDP4501092.1 hypothetical protein [Nonomuraea sp. G32]
MVDYEPPSDLIDLRKAFLASEAMLAELRQTHPAPTAIAAGEAELSDDQRVEWAAALDELRRLAEEIGRHAWWAQVDNRHSAWMALRRAAVDG